MKTNLKIVKETQKAVLVEFQRYVVVSKKTVEELKKKEDIEILDEGKANVLVKTKPIQVWLPKSKIRVEGDKVIEIEDWLAKKKGIPHTLKEIKKAIEEEYKQFKEEQPNIKPSRMLIKKRVMRKLRRNWADEDAVWWYAIIAG